MIKLEHKYGICEAIKLLTARITPEPHCSNPFASYALLYNTVYRKTKEIHQKFEQ